MISDLKYGLFKYDVKDYHAILGIPINADAKTIRSRYLKIAYQLHPDTCITTETDHKSKASQILSKLVNPAYENLYKDKPRRECELILSEMGRRLGSEAYKITLVTDTAKKLYQEDKAREKLYYELIQKLAVDQYKDLDLIIKKIALMSELNMVYLMLLDETKSQPKKLIQTPPVANVQKSTNIAQSDSNIYETQSDGIKESLEDSKSNKNEESADSMTSKVAKLIRNVKQNKEEGNIEQGILDARDALKLDPNNSTCHALIGSLYLEQGNMTYAKIHIKKANELNPTDPEAKEAKEALEKLENKDKPKSSKGGAKSSSHKSNSKDVKSKDNKSVTKSKDNKAKDNKSKDNKSKDNNDDPKKNVPKIFGIYLW